MITQLTRTGSASRRAQQRPLESETIPARAWKSRMHYSTSPLDVLRQGISGIRVFLDLDSFTSRDTPVAGMATS